MKNKSTVNFSKYEDKAVEKLLKDTGGFFAFSTERFKEQKREGVQYVNAGAGLILPKESVQNFNKGFREIVKKVSELRKSQQTEEEIILYELNNYECFHTGDLTDAIAALDNYDFSLDKIKEIFKKHCYSFNI